MCMFNKKFCLSNRVFVWIKETICSSFNTSFAWAHPISFKFRINKGCPLSSFNESKLNMTFDFNISPVNSSLPLTHINTSFSWTQNGSWFYMLFYFFHYSFFWFFFRFFYNKLVFLLIKFFLFIFWLILTNIFLWRFIF